MKHSELIRQMLELDIVAAYYYQRGAIETGLSYDKQLKEACRLLKDETKYGSILHPDQHD